MDDCLRVLETSDESLPSDLTFCQWMKLQRLADDLGAQISAEDRAYTEMSDPSIQYALKGFERQMQEWEKQKSAQITSRMFLHAFRGLFHPFELISIVIYFFLHMRARRRLPHG